MERCAQISSEEFWSIAENSFYAGFREVDGKVEIRVSQCDCEV